MSKRAQSPRILVMRLDRIGDVVLSTPVVQQLRAAYPSALITILVQPACRELVEGNPDLDDVLLYDKHRRHRGIFSTIGFAWGLRRYRFDTVLVLHPTNRSHWIAWFAGIPRRIGYDRKSAWLLTQRLVHRKQEGAKHEAEYALEFLPTMGCTPTAPQLFVPIRLEAKRRVEAVLREAEMQPSDRLVVLHPSSSDANRRWSAERFAQLGDQLIVSHRVRVILVGGAEPMHAEAALSVARRMRQPSLNLAGRLSVGELACVLQRAQALVSNDSGPVHIAAAVGTPVVAIFGRNQPGVNAIRWRPLGEGHVVLERPDYQASSYIQEISVDEVYEATVRVLERGKAPVPAQRP